MLGELLAGVGLGALPLFFVHMGAPVKLQELAGGSVMLAMALTVGLGMGSGRN